MSEISAAQMLSQLQAIASAAGKGGVESAAGAAKGPDFSAMLADAVKAVNQDQLQTSELQKAFVTGDPKVSLSDVMISSQKAGVEFQLMLQVRNKLVSAYQEVMNMQV
ncbi:MAG: flagellar hook-basal body complex protein FliE [Gammaproteobacteria bacterium]|nr:flagellar hook-basal body complex protein FliE [Gammaproteobacteria bacterium]